MYSLNDKVTTSTCDANGNLKLYSALQMMQDCSEMWIDSEPACKQFLQEHSIAQLLASRQVEIVRVPHFKEDLKVTTSIFEVKPMFGFRNTFIYDAQGEVCYKSWSMGAFVNRETGKLTRIDKEVLSQCRIEARLPMDYQDRRIILPEGKPTSYPAVTVMRNDIDYNRHMNNANYIRIAEEILPEGYQFKNMRVEFKMPAKLGQQLLPEMVTAGHTVYVTLRIGDEVSTILEFKE